MTKYISVLIIMLFVSSCAKIDTKVVIKERPIIIEKKQVYRVEEQQNFTPLPPQHNYNENYKLYESLTSDTIISVAKKHNMSPEDLINYNNLKRPYILRPGQMIKIPLTDSEEYKKKLSDEENPDSSEDSSTVIQIAPKG